MSQSPNQQPPFINYAQPHPGEKKRRGPMRVVVVNSVASMVEPAVPFPTQPVGSQGNPEI